MKRKALNAFLHLLFLCGAALFLLPVAYIIISSIQTGNHLTLQPTAFSLDRYLALFFGENRFFPALIRSLWISLSTAIGATVTAFLSGYVLAKVSFKGRNIIFLSFVLLLLCPYQVTIVPNYLMIRLLGLYNTDWALILPGIFAPMTVILLRQFIRQIDDSLCEAYRLDGNSTIRMLLSVVLPCSRVGVALVFILSFAEAWNMVEQPLILLEDTFRYPLSVLLNRVLSGGTVLAGSAVFMLPVFYLIAIFHDQLAEGMTNIK